MPQILASWLKLLIHLRKSNYVTAMLWNLFALDLNIEVDSWLLSRVSLQVIMALGLQGKKFSKIIQIFFTQNRNINPNFILRYSVIHVYNWEKKKGNLLMLRSIAVSTKFPVKILSHLFITGKGQSTIPTQPPTSVFSSNPNVTTFPPKEDVLVNAPALFSNYSCFPLSWSLDKHRSIFKEIYCTFLS